MRTIDPIVLPAERDGQAATTTWNSPADLAEWRARHARQVPEADATQATEGES